MRKLVLIVSIFCAAAVANAQSLTSKNGTPILPEAGEWSIGFDAVGVLNDIGHVMHASGSGDTLSMMNHTLVGSHVKDANTQYRMMLRIGFGSNTVNPSVAGFDAADSATSPSEIKTSEMNITIGAGIQKNRGKGRLQGIYGAQIAIMFGGGSKTTNTFLHVIDSTSAANLGSTRVDEVKGGSTFGLGLNAFVGGEYFVGAKMSVGAEYGWGLMMNSMGESETTTSTWDTSVTPAHVKTETTKGGKASAFSLDVMDATQLFLKIYF
jgi:hypothetical protein